jgi:UDP-N-acetylglucosamine 2-epimerase
MDDQILAIYCLCNDFLKALHHAEDRQHKMTDAEIMTTALVAMLFFGGNFEHARALLSTSQYMPTMLSRRSHASQTAEVMKRLEPILEQLGPDLVLMVGDMNSMLAAAITVAKLQIPVAYVEAGLPSFDRTMPEEINQAVTEMVV